jgi:hypothetical protein
LFAEAFALTEIAKDNPEPRKGLIPKFLKLAKKELDGGMKKIYQKALKTSAK